MAFFRLFTYDKVMQPQTYITLFSAIVLSGALQAFFLAFLVVLVRPNNFRVNRYLAILLITLGTALLNWFLAYSNYFSYAKPLIGFYAPLEIIYGPLIYLYIRGLTQPETERTDKTQLLHFLPVLLACFLLIPFFNLSYEEKLFMIKSGFSLESINDSVLASMGTFILACVISYSIYLYLSFRLLIQHQQKLPNYFSFREKVTLSWVRNLIIVMLLFWLLMVLFLVLLHGHSNMEWYMDGMLLFSIVAILYLGTMGILQPRVYRPIRIRIEQNEEIPVNDEKYKKSALNDEMMSKILLRLKQVMENQQPYLNSNLTLPELAQLVEVSPNYLSQVINEKLQMNFFDYINSHRIEVAKKLLVEPLPYTRTILDIAMESAFNSKSAFYSSFKKQTGLTPVQYKKAYKPSL